jgi:putative heme iron utilization protein
VPQPSLAERARTLVYLARFGTLSTQSHKRPGYPFGSLMPYAADDRGRPVFLASSMAVHTQNLAADPRASLFVLQPNIEGELLGASRVTLLGEVAEIPESERSAIREFYLSRYENARFWVDYQDFRFYRLEVADIYAVAGFGVMGWIASADYRQAQPDPLADAAPAILQHMNADHADALVRIARYFAGEESREAEMISVDRLGFWLRLKSESRIHGVRVVFTREVRDTQDARSVLTEMARQAATGEGESPGGR